MRRYLGFGFVLLLTLALLTGCSSGRAPSDQSSNVATPSAPAVPVSVNKADYPVFPDADAGADPSVSAEQGGKGFKGDGWETNTDFDLIGDPHAVKGGMLRDHLPDFPGTIRIEGPEANTAFNYGITSLVYEALLGIHPNDLRFMPSLATHWQISPDKMTYRFRINPNAKFSDGTPVTADDVVATYDFMMDKTLQSPSNQLTYGKLQRPVAESKYIVSVKAKDLNWRNFIYFSGMAILPGHILKDVNGDKYVKEYNFKVLPGSGAYTINEEDIDKGKSITVRRRKDYWAEKARGNVGLGNFDALRYVIVRDENLALEMFKKGDLDYYSVARAKQWVEEMNFENIQRGLVQKRKIFNAQPQGYFGFAFNTRREPFSDLRVRKAFALLVNRPQMIEKLAFNQYTPDNSYFPGSVYENPNNPKTPYDPEQAVRLLAEAGWKNRDSQGRLVKDGQPLQIEMLYDAKNFEPYLTVYQEDLRRVGISLNLRMITPETLFKMVASERQFQLSMMAWGALLFPNPETSFSSKLADQHDNNNITGVKNARIDEICKQYDTMFNVADRIRAIQEIDGIVANEYHYALLWYAPYSRLIWWNKFGTPNGYFSRTGDYFGAGTGPGVPQMWWIDP